MTRDTTGSEQRIPLYGLRANSHIGDSRRGLTIRTSDCERAVPPTAVTRMLEDIQRQIDRRKVSDGEQHGWIEHKDGDVTDWQIDDDLVMTEDN